MLASFRKYGHFFALAYRLKSSECSQIQKAPIDTVIAYWFKAFSYFTLRIHDNYQIPQKSADFLQEPIQGDLHRGKHVKMPFNLISQAHG